MDIDVDVLAATHGWVIDSAHAPDARARRVALDRIIASQDELRASWLEYFVRDEEPAIRALAIHASAGAADVDRAARESLELEARFAQGVVPHGVQWEWEYRFAVWLPMAGFRDVTVFGDALDIEDARRRALGWPGQLGVFEMPERAAALFCGAWVVCEYSRSPRSKREALRWRTEGRPLPPA